MIKTEKRFRTFKEACLRSGISPSKMYKLTAGRQIRFFKPGGRIFFLDEDLDDYILKGEVTTVDQLVKETEQTLLNFKN
jgi:excisionase family DNA binding protein